MLFSSLLFSLLFPLLIVAAPANAHTNLVSTLPLSAGVVKTLPAQVQLHFDSPLENLTGVRVNQVSVVDSTGRSLNSGVNQVLGDEIVQPILSHASVGLVTVNYRVVSLDAHVTEGSFFFYNKSHSDPQGGIASVTTQRKTPTHNHDTSTTAQKIIYSTSTFLTLLGGVWGIWYYRKKSSQM